MLDGRAPAGRAASSSTTARATSWPPRWPSCSRARGARSSSSPATTTIAPFCAETLEDVLMRERLHACGVAMRTGTVLTGIAPGAARRCDDADGEPLELPAAGVVLVTQRVSARRALPRARRTPRGGLPHRRLRRAAPARRGRLRRPPPRARDRLRRSRGRAAVPARARGRQRRAAARRRAGRRWPSCRRGPQPARRTCEFVDDPGAAAERIDALLRAAGADAVVAVGRGAGDAIERCRRAGRALRRAPRRLAPAGRGRPRDTRRARRRLRRHRRGPHLPRARHLGRAAAPRRHGREPDGRGRQPRSAARGSSSTPTWA